MLLNRIGQQSILSVAKKAFKSPFVLAGNCLGYDQAAFKVLQHSAINRLSSIGYGWQGHKKHEASRNANGSVYLCFAEHFNSPEVPFLLDYIAKISKYCK